MWEASIQWESALGLLLSYFRGCLLSISVINSSGKRAGERLLKFSGGIVELELRTEWGKNKERLDWWRQFESNSGGSKAGEKVSLLTSKIKTDWGKFALPIRHLRLKIHNIIKHDVSKTWSPTVLWSKHNLLFEMFCAVAEYAAFYDM